MHLLQVSCSGSAADRWRRQAHAFKGIALNLGAERLGALCRKAQEMPEAPESVKAGMLTNIRAEYERVKEYLK
jgi:HPt (histidine-containing phosphotransfer) domain-containing protein